MTDDATRDNPLQRRAGTWPTKTTLTGTLMTLAVVCMSASAQSPLTYSSHLGGLKDDQITSVVVALNGDRVVCGSTGSTGLATQGALQLSPAGREDLFVARYSANDNTLLWLTYLGGEGDEFCGGVALDSAGNVVIAGRTASPDFPTFNANDGTYAGGGPANTSFEGDAFITKLAGDGSSMVFSTFLGGTNLGTDDADSGIGGEIVRGLHIDGNDRIVVSGDTAAPDFPAVRTLGDGQCGLDAIPFANSAFIGDQFVARYQPDGTQDFAVCISGDARDAGRGVLVDDDGSIYVTGYTRSTNYPTTEPDIGSADDAFAAYDISVTVLDADATQILRSVRLGGFERDQGINIELNSLGQLVVQGFSGSSDFPTTSGAWQPDFGQDNAGGREVDTVVFILNLELDELLYSTYIGGEKDDRSVSLALDGDQPVLHMATESDGLPTVNGVQSDTSGDLNGFSTFSPDGAAAFAHYTEFSADPQIEGFGVAGPDGNRVYAFNDEREEYEVVAELPGQSADARDIVITDVNGDFLMDVVVGNYESENLLYLATAPGEFAAPVMFGDPQSRTTALGIPQQGCVVEFVEDAINLKHRFDGTFAQPEPYTQTATGSRDAVGSRFSDYLVEVSAADELILYQGCPDNGVSPVVEVGSFPGRDFAKADYRDATIDGIEDVIIADRNGGGIVIPSVPVDGLSAPPFSIDGPPANAVVVLPIFGIVTAHDDRYRYYRAVAPGTFEFDSEQLVSTPVTALYASSVSPRIDVFSATPAGIDWSQVEPDAADLYFIRLTPDLAEATFATYLGGPGDEYGVFGVDVAGPGHYVFGGRTRSAGFPVTNNAQQAMSGGQQDGVLVEFDLTESGVDTDGDGVLDADDNCTLASNVEQIDSDADGFGNACDADLNNDNIVNFADLGIFRLAFFGNPNSDNWNPDADFNGDGNVGFIDLGLMRTYFFGPPGPAGSLAP